MKKAFFFVCGVAFLGGCAAPDRGPVTTPNCAIAAPENDETDGGYGGTGNTAECQPSAIE